MNRKPWIDVVRNHVSLKLGFLLLSIFFIILFSLGSILYSLFLNFYLSHVTGELTQRAHSHAMVLSDHFESMTISHVLRMEKGSSNMVVIQDRYNNVLGSSGEITPQKWTSLSHSHIGLITPIVSEDWKAKPFLVSQYPVLQNGETIGEVTMFSPTAPIRESVNFLRNMLLIAGGITLIIVGGLLFFISRMIVRPLVQMKKATGEIAEGKYSIELPIKGNDEVAQLAESINDMSHRIRFYQEQRNEFLADISHELRTPITYLKGYSDILSQIDLPVEERLQYVKIIGEQSSRLQRLVKDLFDLSRMEQGDFSFHINRFRIDEAVTDVLSLVEVSMDDKNIHLEYFPPETPLFIEGDRERITQVLINILENARKYTPPGSSVYVRVAKNDNSVVIEIEDTGPGIPESEIAYVTERLYRVEKSRSRETGGSGIGLAISKEIIEKHHGTLRINSVEGHGAAFIIQLPVALG
ncbi:HAMP domain-containing sensor histidine kinase [Aneurinibacillus sp. Ricciae_BoGa-3]|uniref:sensor histidine kinase n=1 Tax=Aneurinibacillus sp. Ricciae_BoGa-3 TaxID=3022697 RepID=UPI00233FEF9B|nr:HAMP domain-containing sensor histidine kinase [Aneurinibacillus sp. Ricciae_BoGa-3]WCK52924.1 HAMP domain-containing sensor histidine kinase [Aneurinibacillus sp. Ricciae_BoGa-3]